MRSSGHELRLRPRSATSFRFSAGSGFESLMAHHLSVAGDTSSGRPAKEPAGTQLRPVEVPFAGRFSGAPTGARFGRR